MDVQHIFIVGSKGIPGAYGGYETFVDKLTEYHQNDSRFKYHVACKAEEKSKFYLISNLFLQVTNMFYLLRNRK